MQQQHGICAYRCVCVIIDAKMELFFFTFCISLEFHVWLVMVSGLKSSVVYYTGRL